MILIFLKKFWKEVMIVTLILLLAGAAGTANYMWQQYQLEKQDKLNLIELTSGKDLILKKYVNDNNHLVTRTQALEFQNSTMQKLAEEGQLKWLQEFEGLKRNMKNLESAYKLQAIAGDSVNAKLNKLQLLYVNDAGDTVFYQGIKATHKDKYADLKVVQVSPDSVRFVYKIQVPLSGAVYWKRKWFLGKKIYQAEMTSENPNVVLDSIVTLKTKKKFKK